MPTYIALLRKDRRSDYSVDFPDLPGCVTAGKTLDEAREFAREALVLHLQGLGEDGEAIPAPSSLDAIMAKRSNQDAVALLVEAPAKKPRAVPVTITVAEDLNELVRTKAAEFGMSQSGLYATAVREYLGAGVASARGAVREARQVRRGQARRTAKRKVKA